MTGKLCRVSRNFAHCGPTIVPILPKAFGHNIMTHHQKDQESEDKQPRKPEKMPCILKDAHSILSKTPLSGDRANPSQSDLDHPWYIEGTVTPMMAVCEVDHTLS
jgi:hypothetical protein